MFWRHPKIDAKQASSFLRRFLDLQINLVNVWEDEALLKRICELAEKLDVTFYDASYLALAESFKGKLVTADKLLCEKVPDLAVFLGEFRTG